MVICLFVIFCIWLVIMGEYEYEWDRVYDFEEVKIF